MCCCFCTVAFRGAKGTPFLFWTTAVRCRFSRFSFFSVLASDAGKLALRNEDQTRINFVFRMLSVWSRYRACAYNFLSNNFRRQTHDFEEPFFPQFTGNRPEDTSAARVLVFFGQEDHRISVEPDVTSIGSACGLLDANDHTTNDVTRFHVRAGHGFLYTGDNNVTEASVTTTGSPEHLDAHAFFRTAIVGHIQVRLHLNHCRDSFVSNMYWLAPASPHSSSGCVAGTWKLQKFSMARILSSVQNGQRADTFDVCPEPQVLSALFFVFVLFLFFVLFLEFFVFELSVLELTLSAFLGSLFFGQLSGGFPGLEDRCLH